MQDFSNYRVKVRKPILADWRGMSIISMPPPSSGGIHLVQMLKIYDELSSTYRSSFRVNSKSGEQLDQTIAEIEVMKRVFADRAFHLGDPDFYPVPQKELLNDKYLTERASEIERGQIVSAVDIKPWKKRGDQTTHLSLLDSEGNAISTTQTINYYFGAGVMVPGTGVILNDQMDDFSVNPGTANVHGLVGSEGNKILPGKRPLSSMTPTIVLDREDKVKLVLGSPGGPRIITSVYHVLTGILRDAVWAGKAVSDCRFHHQWSPDKVLVESDCMEEFEPLSKHYELKSYPSVKFSETQIVGRYTNGALYSVSDPRGHGKPLLVE